MTFWKRWQREPLVHFLGLGALLFGLHAVVGGPDRSSTDRIVWVTEGDARRLAATWELQWRRPPTAEELARLVEDHVQEEILYREAMALGLDRDDSIIRRRLAQKMQFLAEDLAEEAAPRESELRAFFEERAAQFEEPARISFTHVFFSPDRRGAEIQEDAQAALTRLRQGGSTVKEGDRSMLQNHFTQRSREEISGLFGAAFADALLTAATGSWEGPVESGYGWHLVRVEERVEAHAPEWAQARERALAAYMDQRRRSANERIYERLRTEYDVRIEANLSSARTIARSGAPE